MRASMQVPFHLGEAQQAFDADAVSLPCRN
jgi:hypothetical protein